MGDSKAFLYVGVAILFWSSVAATAKLLLGRLDSLQVLLFTSIFAALALLIIVLMTGKWRIAKSYNVKDHLDFAWMGFLGIFLYNTLLFSALRLSSAQEAFIVNYTWPLWVMVLAIVILHEEITVRKSIALLLGFIGVYLVATQGRMMGFSTQNLAGNLAALIAAFCYGLFSVLGKKRKHEEFTSMLFYFIYSIIYGVIAVLLFSSFPALNAVEVVGFIWLGSLATGVAFVCWFLALKHGDTGTMANTVFLTPFLSLVWIFFLLNEQILLSSLAGLVLIAAGIWLQSK